MVLNKEQSKKWNRIKPFIIGISIVGFLAQGSLAYVGVNATVDSLKAYTLEEKKTIAQTLTNENNEFVNIVSNVHNLKKVNIIYLGTSIPAGVSDIELSKPLTMRNDELELLCGIEGVELNSYSFALPEENNNEEIFSWINKNFPISKMNKEALYSLKRTKQELDTEVLRKMYPTDIINDVGLADLLSIEEEGTQNIIILGSSTGATLDRITRGTLKEKLTFGKGAEEDLKYLDSILNVIQDKSSQNIVLALGISPTTTIPLTAVVNTIGGKHNDNIEAVTDQYSNAYYVESPKAQYIYETEKGYKFSHHLIDIEYKELIATCLNEFNENYTQHLIAASLTKSLGNHFMDKRENKEDLNDEGLLKDTMLDAITPFVENDGISTDEIKQGITTFINTINNQHTNDYSWADMDALENVGSETKEEISSKTK